MNWDIPSNYTQYIADQLFNYHLKLITQHKALPHWLLKTQNRNVLQNTSQKACQIKSANYLPVHLSAMLRCLILKMILFRCSVNNTNCRSAMQTGLCVQCTVQSFIETFPVAYFLNNYSVCCNPNPITAFTRTKNIMQFSHTDRTNSVHWPAAAVQCLSVCSCSYCTAGPSGQFLCYAMCCLSEDRKLKDLLKMSRDILNIALYLQHNRTGV